MTEFLQDDALLMQEVTDGDPELLAIDLWLHDAFERLRKQEESSSPQPDALPQ